MRRKRNYVGGFMRMLIVCVSATLAVIACRTPEILTPSNTGGPCGNGDQLATLCRDRVTCCPDGYHCAYDGFGCEHDDLPIYNQFGAKLDGGRD